MGSQINIYPSDMTACGLYRMKWPGEAVQRAGKPALVLPKPPQISVRQDGGIHGINVGPAKAVIFQRPGHKHMPEVTRVLQQNGIKVVIDMDDSLSKIHPRNSAYKAYDPRISRDRNWMHAQVTCDAADLVTVTTQALAEEYGKHGRVRIIPNHIPEHYLKIERPENEIPVVGWAGWTANHPEDLFATRGMINQALAETGAKFTAFGDDQIFNHLGIRKRPPHELWGFESVLQYPHRLVGFDIGLVPLAKSEFNEAKSWLKGLEYASLGIVPVVTPIGDYHNLIDLGIAIPAATPKDWYREVKDLVLDNERRAEMSKKCREVAAQWTYEANWHKWWEAWSE